MSTQFTCRQPTSGSKFVSLAFLNLLTLVALTACGVLEVGIEQSAAPMARPAQTSEGTKVSLPTPFPTATPSARMPDQAITSFATTVDGALWYAFDEFDGGGGSPPGSPQHGLYRSKDGRVTHYDVPGTIRVLEVAPDGSLYVGAGCGVLRHRDDQLETLAEVDCSQDTFAQAFVPFDIVAAENNHIWVGGVYSLARFDGETWTEYDVHVGRLLVAADDSLWGEGWDGIAGSNCCFVHIRGSAWVTFTHSATLPVSQELLHQVHDLTN